MMFNGLMSNLVGVCGNLKGSEPFSYGKVISEPPSMGFPKRDNLHIQDINAVSYDRNEKIAKHRELLS